MITYDTGSGGAYPIKSKDFFIDATTLGSTTNYGMVWSDMANNDVLPIGFYCYNKTDAAIDKLSFRDGYIGDDYTHEINIYSGELLLIPVFNQGINMPQYDPFDYSSQQINVFWSNLGHTYSQSGLYIRIFYYLTKHFI